MILDAQNLHTFSQNRQTPGLQPGLQVLVLDFLVCSRAEHVKLVLCKLSLFVASCRCFERFCLFLCYVAPFL